VLQVHHGVALSRSPQEHVHKLLAPTPIPKYPCHMEWWEYQIVVSIFGDHLGLLFCSDRPGICGYDRLAICVEILRSIQELHTQWRPEHRRTRVRCGRVQLVYYNVNKLNGHTAIYKYGEIPNSDNLELAYGGSTSSALSSCHIYDAGLLTPPRQCTHKTRFSIIPLPFGGRPPPCNWYCITQDNDPPLHHPLHSHPNTPPRAPLKLPPTHRKQSRPSPYPRCEQAWGLCTSLPVRSPRRLARRLANRVSRLRQTYMRVSSY